MDCSKTSGIINDEKNASIGLRPEHDRCWASKAFLSIGFINRSSFGDLKENIKIAV